MFLFPRNHFRNHFLKGDHIGSIGTTRGKIGLPLLAGAKGVGKQEHVMKVKDIIYKYWGDILFVSGKTKYGIMKELVDGGGMIMV